MGLIIGPLSNVPPIISTPVATMGKTCGAGDSRNRNDENLTYNIDDNPSGRVCYHSQRTFGLWLSLVERCVRDAEAAGSNPVNPTRDQRREPTGSLLVLAGGVDSLRKQAGAKRRGFGPEQARWHAIRACQPRESRPKSEAARVPSERFGVYALAHREPRESRPKSEACLDASELLSTRPEDRRSTCCVDRRVQRWADHGPLLRQKMQHDP